MKQQNLATDRVCLVSSDLLPYHWPGSILYPGNWPRHMLPNGMTSRQPADLVDFASPPVTEVVLGVQFNSLERFLSPYLGIVWSEFKHEFPIIEEYPSLPPTFETFGAPAAFIIP